MNKSVLPNGAEIGIGLEHQETVEDWVVFLATPFIFVFKLCCTPKISTFDCLKSSHSQLIRTEAVPKMEASLEQKNNYVT